MTTTTGPSAIDAAPSGCAGLHALPNHPPSTLLHNAETPACATTCQATPVTTSNSEVESAISRFTKRKRGDSSSATEQLLHHCLATLPGTYHDAITTLFKSTQHGPMILRPVKTLSEDDLRRLFGLCMPITGDLWHRAKYTLQMDQLMDNGDLELKQVPLCLMRYLYLEAKISVRKSEAICRALVNNILVECLALLSGYEYSATENSAEHDATDCDGGDDGLHTSTNNNPYTLIKLYGEVALEWQHASTRYTGRLDYSLGIRSTSPLGDDGALRKPIYVNLLGVVEAKRDRDVDLAYSQLLGYLGCIYNARKVQGKRRDCSTYGIATDGYIWEFVMISHAGHVLTSERIDISKDPGKMLQVMKCIIHVIQRCQASVTPANSPCKGIGEGDDAAVSLAEQDESEYLDCTGGDYVAPRPSADLEGP